MKRSSTERRRKLSRPAIWALEITCEAILTVACLLILSDFTFKHTLPDQHGFYAVLEEDLRQYLLLGGLVLIFFTLTGYFLTTAIAAYYLAGKKNFVYPSVSAVLYLLHSSIIILLPHKLPLQICGALITFGVTVGGDRLRGLWSA